MLLFANLEFHHFQDWQKVCNILIFTKICEFSALGNLQAPGLGKKPSKLLFEPGYDAVDRNSPIATGKTDGDSVNLPATFGKVEILKGVGMGIGKK